jgi:hypothetical protein
MLVAKLIVEWSSNSRLEEDVNSINRQNRKERQRSDSGDDQTDNLLPGHFGSEANLTAGSAASAANRA